MHPDFLRSFKFYLFMVVRNDFIQLENKVCFRVLLTFLAFLAFNAIFCVFLALEQNFYSLFFCCFDFFAFLFFSLFSLFSPLFTVFTFFSEIFSTLPSEFFVRFEQEKTMNLIKMSSLRTAKFTF